MSQQIIVIILFAAAVGYLGWRVWKSLDSRDGGCSKGCGCAGEKGSPLKS